MEMTDVLVVGTNALLAVRQKKPDLILLDMNLPERDGYAAAKELRASPTS
jgi:CheY-like chemotaxis protein